MTNPQGTNEHGARSMSSAVAAAAGCSALAKDVVDAAIELHTEYANLAAACLARAAQSLYSVTHLAQLGLNGDAMSVARTIVELAIDIAYIARDPTTLIPMFVDYSHIRNFQLAQAVDRLHGGTVDRDAMRVLRERHDDYIAQNPDSEHNWAGHGLRWRAERVRGDDTWRRQCVQMYELLYADMCGASHSGYTTLKYTLVGDPAAPSIHFGRMSPETKPIMLAFAAMLQMMSTIVDACGIGDRFETRFSELNRLAVAAEQPELPAPENSEQRNDVPDAFAVSNGLWNECHLAYQIVNGPARIALLGEGGGAGRLPVQWRPGYLRLVAWMHSLSQLQSPSDFQAVFAATRSLLEILVDAVLLRHQADAAAQMADWEESAKLKHAQAIRRFYTGKSQIPRDHQEAIAFAERQNTAITARRIARGWVKKNQPYHPSRWTARNLDEDARIADGLEPGLGLEAIYETQYRQMCWYVHASAAVGLRGVGPDLFPMLGGFAFRMCSTLAVKYAKLMLQYADAWDSTFDGEPWEVIFERLRRVQALTVATAALGPQSLERLAVEAKEANDEDHPS